MTDPRVRLGHKVEPGVVPPFGIVKQNRSSPDEGGTLDCGLTAHTEDGQLIVIGEVWAACPGPAGSKVRIDARAIAQGIADTLNGAEE